ncbi:uncharacterized protein LOC127842467 [Dreissena polymorpha]|uniref:uncharacterized protein LOC127842467 n=1 Tax=Dreissena polymorpha TaxID=45954 RepID=UPI0022640BBE|nr:uncharacterized protein LOC127842467 [Dreissena polymorpha]
MPKRKHNGDNSLKPETQTENPAKRQEHNDTVDEARILEAAETQLYQSQIKLQQQRTLEASRQMLYGVYGNLVAILEEYEARTHNGTPLPRSNITLPDQSTKSLEDVESIVQGQLLAFQMQSKACHPDVRNEVNKDLRKKTLIWAAVREEKTLEMQTTDTFICQLYKILAKGKTRHEILENRRQSDSIKTIKDTLPHIMQGKHDAATLDESFKKDPGKKASSPQTRLAYADNSFKLGASRMKRKMPDFSHDLDTDVEHFLLDEPDSYR